MSLSRDLTFKLTEILNLITSVRGNKVITVQYVDKTGATTRTKINISNDGMVGEHNEDKVILCSRIVNALLNNGSLSIRQETDEPCFIRNENGEETIAPYINFYAIKFVHMDYLIVDEKALNLCAIKRQERDSVPIEPTLRFKNLKDLICGDIFK